MDGKAIKSAATKNKILSVSTRLFYEKGLDSTSLDEIARECGITKPLIIYHFSSKINIAKTIYREYTDDQRQIFFQKAREIENKYKNVEILMAYRLQSVKYYRDVPEAIRFFTELFTNNFGEVVQQNNSIGYFGITPSIDPDILHLRQIGAQYARRGLILHYANGDINCSWETFAWYFTNMTMMFYISQNTIRQTLPKAMKLLEDIHIDYLPYFQWK